jgi:orotidine-5'-phosphate decarboxylase
MEEDPQMTGKPELIVALDVKDTSEVRRVVETLGEQVSFYKVGLELFVSDGFSALAYLKHTNKRVFLDLKLHDIPRTVARAVTSCAKRGADLITVHAAGGREMLCAAAEACAETDEPHPRIVAVTTLTSLDQNNIEEMGVNRSLHEHTLAMGKLAVSCGVDGLVCSVWEASDFRNMLGSSPLLVTPGIRQAGGNVGDQKRVATPAAAVRAGASFLVVGRPILDAADPSGTARAIVAEMLHPEGGRNN